MKELLVWEPFTLEVLASLGGVSPPVVAITVSDSMQKIFACTVGKEVLIYHSSTYRILQVRLVDGPTGNLPLLLPLSSSYLLPSFLPAHRW